VTGSSSKRGSRGRSRTLFSRLCLALALALLGVSADASDTIQLDVGRSPGGWLLVDVTVDRPLDSEAAQALRTGLPTALEYRLELWRDRSSVWDVFVERVETRYRLFYDALSESYTLLDVDEEIVLDGEDFETVESFLAHQEIEFLALSALRPRSGYYVVMELEIQPLSIDEIRDLEDWIRGASDRGRVSGISGGLIGALRNRVGLGGRAREGRSPHFRPNHLRTRENRDGRALGG